MLTLHSGVMCWQCRKINAGPKLGDRRRLRMPGEAGLAGGRASGEGLGAGRGGAEGERAERRLI